MHFIIICNNIALNPSSIYSVYIQYIGMFPFSQELYPHPIWEPLVCEFILHFRTLGTFLVVTKCLTFCVVLCLVWWEWMTPLIIHRIPVVIGAPPTHPCAKKSTWSRFPFPGMCTQIHPPPQPPHQKKLIIYHRFLGGSGPYRDGLDSTSAVAYKAFKVDKPARLTIRVLWFLFLIDWLIVSLFVKS